MASKISPLYAETRILLSLFALDENEVSRSYFVPQGPKYKQALVSLVEDGCLTETLKGKRYKKYSLSLHGQERLVENLFNKELSFFSNLGPKTTNGLLKAFRELKHSETSATQNGSQNGHGQAISSYKEFSDFVLDFCRKIDAEDNLDGLIPIYRVRREVGEVVDREQFDNWLFELQADNSLQMMGDDLSDTPQDQKDDSVQIPGGNLRFYIKLL
ncbi:MAG: hypothetical protein ACFB14_15050 [Leptolyngbyaceae cyanobacterium]